LYNFGFGITAESTIRGNSVQIYGNFGTKQWESIAKIRAVCYNLYNKYNGGISDEL
jgi:hypothetical protein